MTEIPANVNSKIDEERDPVRQAFISDAAKRASIEIGELRRNGQFVCDISYITGSMTEAAIEYDSKPH